MKTPSLSDETALDRARPRGYSLRAYTPEDPCMFASQSQRRPRLTPPRRDPIKPTMAGMDPFRTCFASAAACLLLSNCAGAVSVSARHDPLYSAAPHTSNIKAEATPSRGATINDISVDVILGEMTTCTELGMSPSLIPCRRNATLASYHCAAGAAQCSIPLTLGDRSLVSYRATATDSAGKSASTEYITYSGGASITSTPAGPSATNTIPWEVARPMYWHTGWPLPVKPPNHLNVAFFPDQTDFGGNYVGSRRAEPDRLGRSLPASGHALFPLVQPQRFGLRPLGRPGNGRGGL